MSENSYFQYNLPKQNHFLANLTLSLFILFLITIIYFSHELKVSPITMKKMLEQTLLFRSKELATVDKIILKNKLGEFAFKYSRDAGNSKTWMMTSPQTSISNSIFIEKLFSALKSIKIKKILANTPVNQGQFSLNSDIISLTLINHSDSEGLRKETKITFGVMNPIDNSTYIKLSDKNALYHIESPASSLENVGLSELIETTVFNLPFEELQGIKILKKSTPTPYFSTELKANQWSYKDKIQEYLLESDQLKTFLKDFLNLRGKFLMEKSRISELQKKELSTLFATPEYKINLLQKNGNERQFIVSKITDQLQDIVLNNEPHFLIQEKNGQIIFVVKNEEVKVFDFDLSQIPSLTRPSAVNNP